MSNGTVSHSLCLSRVEGVMGLLQLTPTYLALNEIPRGEGEGLTLFKIGLKIFLFWIK